MIMKNLYPDLYVENISEITASMLMKMGMEAVVLDIDNTLVPHDDPNPTPSVKAFLKDMHENGIKICVVSNNRIDRVKPFCEKIGIKNFVCDALKPKAYGYEEACRVLGCDLKRTVGIGDQIFTDIWGGNRAGCFTVLVKPIDKKSETRFIKFKRILEKPFLRKAKRDDKL